VHYNRKDCFSDIDTTYQRQNGRGEKTPQVSMESLEENRKDRPEQDVKQSSNEGIQAPAPPPHPGD
jgi:hypothetical protein